MPSVEVIWLGRCADQQDQVDLVKHALSLSLVSSELNMQFHGSPVNTVLYTGLEEYGRLLILGTVFGNQPIPKGIKEVENEVYLAEDMRLFGLEFSLFDPRFPTSGTYYDCRKQFSMIFTRSDKPELDGWLVSLCQVSPRSRLVEYSQLVLRPPTLTLRYYLEGTVSRLLGWMKHYYIPGLLYWVHEDLAGYDRDWKDLPKSHDVGAEKFTMLLNEFEQEGREFNAYIGEINKKEESLRSKSVSGHEGEKDQDME